MTISLFLFIALAGLLIGILAGMFGIGGGVLIIPTLNLAFSFSPLISAATSLFVIAPTALSGAAQHLRQGSVDVKAAVLFGAAGAAASILSSLFSERIPGLVIIIISACLIMYSASTMIHGALKPVGTAQGSIKANHIVGTKKGVVACVAVGLFAGAMAGIVGLGGGFIIIPICVTYFGYSFKQATGISLLAIAIIALPGIITHAIFGHISYYYGLALMPGTILGAYLGARLQSRLPEKPLRLVFSALLVILGVLLLANQMAHGM